MEFKEFSNPEEKDYDINSSLKSNAEETTKKGNPYVEILINLVGFLEDDEPLEIYGITEEEYFNPTRETIIKVKKVLENKTKSR